MFNQKLAWTLLLCGMALAVQARVHAAAPRGGGPAVIQERIDKQIAELKGESLAESLKLLSEVEMYLWPGYRGDRTGEMRMPLAKDAGRLDLEEIMSNRRFLKVMTELAALPKDQAGKMVAREMEEGLPVYEKLLEASIAKLVNGINNAPPGVAHSSGLSMQINNNKDHSPTLKGMRLKVLALVLAAGNLDLTDANDAVRAVATYACAQRDELYKPHDVLSEADRFHILQDATLYNRQILAAGMLQHSGPKARPGEDRWEGRKLTKYDARTTAYDTMAGAQGPLDYLNGAILVMYPVALTDAEMNTVMRK
jgi:hypothetical protein